MLKIIDVDYIDGYRLAVQFSDGLTGEADLTPFFSEPPFSDVDGFLNFGLTESGSLSWGDDLELSAYTVRSVTVGSVQAVSLPDATDVEAVMKLAAWDSVTEGRPDILCAAIYGFAECTASSRSSFAIIYRNHMSVLPFKVVTDKSRS